MKKLIYRWIRRKHDKLKRSTDRRYKGIWMSDAPELLNGQELLAGDVLFCGQPQVNGGKLTELIQNTTDGVYVSIAASISAMARLWMQWPAAYVKFLLSTLSPTTPMLQSPDAQGRMKRDLRRSFSSRVAVLGCGTTALARPWFRCANT